MTNNKFPEEALLPEKDHYTKEEIDTIPVFYCTKCGSLDIRRYDTEGIPMFCGKCSGTNIEKCKSIYKWEEIIKNK